MWSSQSAAYKQLCEVLTAACIPTPQVVPCLEEMTGAVLALELSGWNGTEALKPESLGASAIKAGAQIINNCTDGGFVAFALSWIYGQYFASQMLAFNRKCASPIDPDAFRAYHHSSKVRAQNVMVLDEHVSRGRKNGYNTSDISAFVSIAS